MQARERPPAACPALGPLLHLSPLVQRRNLLALDARPRFQQRRLQRRQLLFSVVHQTRHVRLLRAVQRDPASGEGLWSKAARGAGTRPCARARAEAAETAA